MAEKGGRGHPFGSAARPHRRRGATKAVLSGVDPVGGGRAHQSQPGRDGGDGGDKHGGGRGQLWRQCTRWKGTWK